MDARSRSTLARYNLKISLALPLTVLILIIYLPSSNSGLASDESYHILPYNSKPYGLKYGEWTEKWAQWIQSIPQDRNPLLDPTGRFCGDGQSNPNVFFLAGTLGGKAERTCIISSDKALFFPIFRSDAINATDFESVDADKLISGNQDALTLLVAQIDNKSLTDFTTLRTQSQYFNLTYPEDNNTDFKSGLLPIAISNGTWIMLAPLDPGYHQLKFQGVVVDPDIGDQENLAVDITYHIDVTAS
ncbi:MAG TPA: hypothetical protein VE130_14745 [Nitrososphaeraceae archaeon]|nr:hypothetical protein [Nitrososphaeraceae archaeon]